jgi:hypothetical protein
VCKTKKEREKKKRKKKKKKKKKKKTRQPFADIYLKMKTQQATKCSHPNSNKTIQGACDVGTGMPKQQAPKGTRIRTENQQ